MYTLGQKRSYAASFPLARAGIRKKRTALKPRFQHRTTALSRKSYPASAELKYVDTTLSSGTTRCDTTGDLILLNGTIHGDDVLDRVGRKFTMRSLECHLWAKVTASTGVDQVQRVMVVLDKQANGAAPIITDVLVSAAPNAMKNLNNAARFTILHDEFYHLNASAEADSQKAWKFYQRFIIPVQFNSGNAGTVADINSGSLYFICLGSEVRGNTAGDINGRVRVRFTDF